MLRGDRSWHPAAVSAIRCSVGRGTTLLARRQSTRLPNTPSPAAAGEGAGGRGYRLLLAGVLTLLLLPTACRAERQPDVVHVYAAASLTEVLDVVKADVEAQHPGLTVRLNLGPSSGLATQIRSGAPADLLLAAAPRWVDAVEDQPGIRRRAELARNRLVVVTPRDNPADIADLADLGRPGVRLALGAPGVPAGDYARQMLDRAGVALPTDVSGEQSVKGVVQKTLLGEADAGVVYATDVTPAVAERLHVVAVPDDLKVAATYELAVLADTAVPALADAVADYLLGPGQDTLRAAGFAPPRALAGP